MLRLALPGLLLLPIVIKRGLGLDRLGWSGLCLLIVSGGVPYALLAATGLRYAPAHHQAALNPGCMPIFVALIATLWMGEKISRMQRVGLGLILTGALLIVSWQGPAWQPTLAFGHVLFLAASLLWACFTVILRHGQLEPLHAIAIVSLGSWLFLPVYFLDQWHQHPGGADHCHRLSGCLPGRRHNDTLADPLCPRAQSTWRCGRWRVRRPRTGAVRLVRHSVARRMADPIRLARRRAHLNRRLSGERRSATRPSTRTPDRRRPITSHPPAVPIRDDRAASPLRKPSERSRASAATAPLR